MLLALVGLHGALALCAPAIARRLGRGVFLVCGLAPLATVVAVAANARAVLDGVPLTSTLAWAPDLGVELTTRVDAFSMLMIALVSGIGVGVFIYSWGYFSKPRGDLGRFALALTAFAGSMLGLVTADSLLGMFVFWELTSVTSYLLIGFEHTKAKARDAALQALLTTGTGGLLLLGGVVLLIQATGETTLSGLLATGVDPGDPLVSVGLLLMLLAAATKSAQVPFHTWLPGAMAAPTPVSAYLHSATMVKAGVYLIARIAPFAAVVAWWTPTLIAVGFATMLVGGYRALRQHDLKLLLAYGTISQLGFMIALFGIGTPETTFAATALLLAHGLFKAALFMLVGVIDKLAGTRDRRHLGGLGRHRPVLAGAGILAAASMAGLAPLIGFIAKEAAYEGLLHGGDPLGGLGTLATGLAVAGSVLTVAYSARFVIGAFGAADDPAAAIQADTVPPPSRVFAGPAVLLAGLSVLFGIVPLLVDGLVNAAATALDPRWVAHHLELWHGFNVALGLSVLTIALGVALFVARRQVEDVQARMPAMLGATAGYEGIVRGLLQGSKALTAKVQHGSLPLYAATILTVVVVLPGLALVRTGLPSSMPPFMADQGQLTVAVVAGVAAIASLRVRRRFAAVLLLGAVGYSVGMLFVLAGAPDLALTQFLVETLIVIIFVLVLRHLPRRFPAAQVKAIQGLRIVVAIAVGVFASVFALIASSARTAPSLSDEYLLRALPEADGRNVVNVILVDFRALDTLGEITVLAVAGLGIAALVRAVRAERAEHAGGDPDTVVVSGELEEDEVVAP